MACFVLPCRFTSGVVAMTCGPLLCLRMTHATLSTTQGNTHAHTHTHTHAYTHTYTNTPQSLSFLLSMAGRCTFSQYSVSARFLVLPLTVLPVPRYSSEYLPATESLEDCVARTLPFWTDSIVPAIKAGKRVIVAAHGNSLRGIVKHLDNLTDQVQRPLRLDTTKHIHHAYRTRSPDMMQRCVHTPKVESLHHAHGYMC